MTGLISDLLSQYAALLGLLTVRCMAVFTLVPVFSGVGVPLRIRGAVAVVVAVVLTPSLTVSAPEGMAELLAAGLGELILGLCMGMIVRLSFFAAELAGGALGLQMGLAFSQVVDPLTSEQSPISSRMLGLFATMLLVAADGHRMVLAAVATSLMTVPPGAVLGHFDDPSGIFTLLSVATTTALRIAAPVMVALFVANVALALLARAAPQLQLFMLSFGLSIMLGMMILTSSSRFGLSLVTQQVQQIGQQLAAVVGM
jgi:flagellar biosynthetic protein FliR